MVIIDVKEALKAKPKPTIVIIGRSVSGKELVKEVFEAIPKEFRDISQKTACDNKSQLLSELTAQERDIHRSRNKYSNHYHALESQKAPIKQFEANYNKIESYTKDLQDLYLKKQHVEQHGSLPEAKQVETAETIQNVFQLKEKRRSLNNIKSKLNNKLKLVARYPIGSPTRQEMLQKYTVIEAEQEYITRKIKQLNGREE